MILTVSGFKGGVAKTTTAIHLAAYLQRKAPTLLIDGDLNRSATGWARRGTLPFTIVDERQAARYAPQFKHIVIDTQARPTVEDLRTLVDGCDLLIIPTTPDALSLEALTLTLNTLQQLGANRYRILLTIIPPRPSKDGDEARATLSESQVPLFQTGIRRFAAFQKAALAGVPVYKVSDPRAPLAWQDYQSAGKEILL